MKTLKNTFAFLLLALFSISCSRSDDNPAAASTPSTATNNNFIRCKIDGVDYEALGPLVNGAQNSLAFDFRSDISSGGIGIDISLYGQAAVGTYSPSYSNATTVGRLNYRSPDIYSSGICTTSAGTLTITAKNGNTIEGTFNFSGKKVLGCSNAAKTITNGTFKVTLL
jgi:hypothetical protein